MYLLISSILSWFYPGNSKSLWRQGLAGLGRKESLGFLESEISHTHSHICPDPPRDHTDTSLPPTLWWSSSIRAPFCTKYFTSGWLFHRCLYPSLSARVRAENSSVDVSVAVGAPPSMRLSLLLQADLSHCVQNSNSSRDIWDDQSGRLGEISFPTIVMGSARLSLPLWPPSEDNLQ